MRKILLYFLSVHSDHLVNELHFLIRNELNLKIIATVVCSFQMTAQKGTTNLTFFKKIKNTGPLMGAKLKSKTHLQNTFFYFLSRFLRVWLQSLKKVLIWPKNFFFLIEKGVKKRRISCWFRIRWKSCEKMHQK